jgi:hypothetical protein
VFLLKVAIFIDIITQSHACTLRCFGGAYMMVFRRKVFVETILRMAIDRTSRCKRIRGSVPLWKKLTVVVTGPMRNADSRHS